MKSSLSHQQALGKAGVDFVGDLTGGQIQAGNCSYDLLFDSTRFEIKTSWLWLSQEENSTNPSWAFCSPLKPVHWIILVGSWRLANGLGTRSYRFEEENGAIGEVVVRDRGPLIVAPWLFLFTMDEALQNGLQSKSTIRYTPGNGHGKWFKFLNDHRISEAGLMVKSVCRDFLIPVL